MRTRPLQILAVLLLLATDSDASAQFTQTARLVASDGLPEDNFGRSVAVDGTTAVIGAPFTDDASPGVPTCASGAAYVFERVGGTWLQAQRLVASDPACSTLFGGDVAISGDTLVVGAPWRDVASGFPNCDSGAAYVFERSAGTWIERQRLVPSMNACGIEFGGAVAIDGDWIVAGAARSPTPAAYVFHRVGGVWVEDQRIVGSSTTAFDGFGGAVGIDGGTIVVGARSTQPADQWHGSGYVFARGPSGWIEQAILDTPGLAGLGSMAAISGNTVALGTPADTCCPSQGCCTGGAAVWVRQGSSWSFQASFFEPAGGERFGSSLALDRDTMVIGDITAATCDPGAAHAYTRTGSAWVRQPLNAAPLACFANLGWDVAVSGDVALVGAPTEPQSIPNGAVYVFERANPATTTCAGHACPCGNDDPSAGCANSTGVGAQLFAVGSTSIAADDLQLRATDLPSGALCLFAMGGVGAPVSVFDGRMCMTTPRWRLPPVQSSGPGGTAAVARPLSVGGASLAPGAVVGIQCFYRDPGGPCGGRANLSDALVVTFTP